MQADGKWRAIGRRCSNGEGGGGGAAPACARLRPRAPHQAAAPCGRRGRRALEESSALAGERRWRRRLRRRGCARGWTRRRGGCSSARTSSHTGAQADSDAALVGSLTAELEERRVTESGAHRVGRGARDEDALSRALARRRRHAATRQSDYDEERISRSWERPPWQCAPRSTTSRQGEGDEGVRRLHISEAAAATCRAPTPRSSGAPSRQRRRSPRARHRAARRRTARAMRKHSAEGLIGDRGAPEAERHWQSRSRRCAGCASA